MNQDSRISSTKVLPSLFGNLSGRWTDSSAAAPADHPLIVAVHGGTYSSRYFDVPGYSLIDRAAALGLPVLAVDRPGYEQSVVLPASSATLRGNADFLRTALGDAWNRYRGSARGIVLIGHSIGAAIAMMVASDKLDWPLLGIAISGVGLRTPQAHHAAWAGLPDTYLVEMPSALKDQVMFGPVGSYDRDMPQASHIADRPVPKAELVDIVSTWHEVVSDVASRISVPVHYRQGEFDALWIVNEQEVSGVGKALMNSPFVDARMVPGMGHCLDFHRYGAAFHVQQLGFALQCAARADRPS